MFGVFVLGIVVLVDLGLDVVDNPGAGAADSDMIVLVKGESNI